MAFLKKTSFSPVIHRARVHHTDLSLVWGSLRLAPIKFKYDYSVIITLIQHESDTQVICRSHAQFMGMRVSLPVLVFG